MRTAIAGFLALLAADAAFCQPRTPAPFHADEPIVISDGNLKVEVYSTSGKDSSVDGDTVTARAFSTNQATLHVPVRVVSSGGQAKLRFTSTLAHPALEIDRYIYHIDRFNGTRFVPYAAISFTLKNAKWIIAPGGANPLKLTRTTGPVALTGAWAEHFLTTYEFGAPGAVLRLAAVSIVRRGVRTTRIRLGTGCTAFRIEPSIHTEHDMPFDNSPCQDTPALRAAGHYPTVRINSAKPVRAIDVGVALARSRRE